MEFTEKNIVEETPSVEELKKVLEYSGLPIKKFFNTKRYALQRAEYQRKNGYYE